MMHLLQATYKNDMIRNIIYLTFLSILLNSCSGVFVSQKQRNRILSGELSLVVMQTTPIINTSLFSNSSRRISLTWDNLQKKDYSFSSENTHILTGEIFKIEAYTVFPGRYSLTTLQNLFDRGGVESRNYISNFIEFDVKGGEIIYIGNIVIDLKNYLMRDRAFLKKAISIKNNETFAKEFIEGKYPEFQGKLETRLLELNVQN